MYDAGVFEIPWSYPTIKTAIKHRKVRPPNGIAKVVIICPNVNHFKDARVDKHIQN